MERLDDDQVLAFVEKHDAWSQKGDAIERVYKAPTARAAIAKLMRIADLSEGANHHPELTWVYNTLTILLTTHDAGGVTTLDFELAAAMNATAG